MNKENVWVLTHYMRLFGGKNSDNDHYNNIIIKVFKTRDSAKDYAESLRIDICKHPLSNLRTQPKKFSNGFSYSSNINYNNDACIVEHEYRYLKYTLA